jgi:hypothetical protein
MTGGEIEAVRACVNAEEAMLHLRTVCFVNANPIDGVYLSSDTREKFRHIPHDTPFHIPMLEACFAIVSRPDGNYGIAYTVINATDVIVDFAEACECREGYVTPAFFVGTYEAHLNPHGGFSTEWKDEEVSSDGVGWTKGYKPSKPKRCTDPEHKPWAALGQDVSSGQNLTPLTLVKNAVGAVCAKLDSGIDFDLQHCYLGSNKTREVLFVRSVSKPSHLLAEHEILMPAGTPLVTGSTLVNPVMENTMIVAGQNTQGTGNSASMLISPGTSAVTIQGEAPSFAANNDGIDASVTADALSVTSNSNAPAARDMTQPPRAKSHGIDSDNLGRRPDDEKMIDRLNALLARVEALETALGSERAEREGQAMAFKEEVKELSSSLAR